MEHNVATTPEWFNLYRNNLLYSEFGVTPNIKKINNQEKNVIFLIGIEGAKSVIPAWAAV
jgi:hypothetical protein